MNGASMNLIIAAQSRSKEGPKSLESWGLWACAFLDIARCWVSSSKCQLAHASKPRPLYWRDVHQMYDLKKSYGWNRTRGSLVNWFCIKNTIPPCMQQPFANIVASFKKCVALLPNFNQNPPMYVLNDFRNHSIPVGKCSMLFCKI